MKTFFTVLLFFTFLLASKGQISTNCLPEKGIKFAKTIAEKESAADEANRNINYREVHYDKKGRVILIKDGGNGPLFRRGYKDGQLQFITSTRKELPDFYSAEDFTALNKNAGEVTDTANIISYHQDGEPAALKHADGAIQTFEYKGCLEESNTFLSADGDTIQQYRTIFENGVVIKTIWTPFRQVKSDIITDYYNYTFNKNGHWIRREYKDNEGDVIIEKRELTYYE